jgi:hypothetical protein
MGAVRCLTSRDNYGDVQLFTVELVLLPLPCLPASSRPECPIDGSKSQDRLCSLPRKDVLMLATRVKKARRCR